MESNYKDLHYYKPKRRQIIDFFAYNRFQFDYKTGENGLKYNLKVEALNLGLNLIYPGKGASCKGLCWDPVKVLLAAEPSHNNKRAGICIKQTIPAHKSLPHKS